MSTELKSSLPTSLERLSASKFARENSAESNRYFLYDNRKSDGVFIPIKGWKIIGWGTPPYCRTDQERHVAVMFERTDEEESCSLSRTGAPEGERIWQHFPPRDLIALFPLETSVK